jgi:hypothetical protein
MKPQYPNVKVDALIAGHISIEAADWTAEDWRDLAMAALDQSGLSREDQAVVATLCGAEEDPASEHPMQPVELDEDGTARFKANKIVTYLMDLCRTKGIADLNTLALMPFTREDWEQFTQLRGYSIDGAAELPFMDAEIIAIADAAAKRLRAAKEARK